MHLLVCYLNIQTRTFAPTVTQNSLRRCNQQMHTNILTQLLFPSSNRISLMHGLTNYLKSVTQNSCFQTANWRSIQPSRIASHLWILADTNHGKPNESRIMQLLIPLNHTLLISNLLHRLKVFLFYVLQILPLFQPIMYVQISTHIKPLDTTGSPIIYSHKYIIRIQIFLVVTLRHKVGGSLRRRVTGKWFLVKPYPW